MQVIAAESLAIQITDGGSRSIVQLAGELELASAAACREALDGILDEGRADILIDLRGLTFLDSMGLSTLLHAHLVGAERGRRVSFIRGGHAVQRVFEITEMDARVEWADAVERVLSNASRQDPAQRPRVSAVRA
jgi:anti-sigma B factor antagonist